jgi:hypothetical protein
MKCMIKEGGEQVDMLFIYLVGFIYLRAELQRHKLYSISVYNVCIVYIYYGFCGAHNCLSRSKKWRRAGCYTATAINAIDYRKQLPAKDVIYHQ